MWLLVVMFAGALCAPPRIEAVGLHDTEAMCMESAAKVRAVIPEDEKVTTLCLHTRQ